MAVLTWSELEGSEGRGWDGLRRDVALGAFWHLGLLTQAHRAETNLSAGTSQRYPCEVTLRFLGVGVNPGQVLSRGSAAEQRANTMEKKTDPALNGILPARM